MPDPITAVIGGGASVVGGAIASRGSKSAAKTAADASKEANAGASHLAFTQADIAQEQWDWHRENALPVMGGLATDAQGYDTPARQEQMAGIARADVGKSFGLSRQSHQRDMMRYGINPNSGRFVGLNQQMGTNEALAKAGAGTTARRAVDDAGFNRKLQAGQLISGQAAGVQAGLGSAASALAGIGASQQNAATQASAGVGQLYGGLTGTAGNLAAAYFARPQASSANFTGLSSVPSGLGLYGNATSMGYYNPTKF